MHAQEYECLDCDKLFHLKSHDEEKNIRNVRCPVCGSANISALPPELQEFLEENFGEMD